MRDSGTIRFLYLGDVQFEDSAAEYEEWERMTEKIYEENNDIDFAAIRISIAYRFVSVGYVP